MKRVRPLPSLATAPELMEISGNKGERVARTHTIARRAMKDARSPAPAAAAAAATLRTRKFLSPPSKLTGFSRGQFLTTPPSLELSCCCFCSFPHFFYRAPAALCGEGRTPVAFSTHRRCSSKCCRLPFFPSPEPEKEAEVVVVGYAYNLSFSSLCPPPSLSLHLFLQFLFLSPFSRALPPRSAIFQRRRLAEAEADPPFPPSDSCSFVICQKGKERPFVVPCNVLA